MSERDYQHVFSLTNSSFWPHAFDKRENIVPHKYWREKLPFDNFISLCLLIDCYYVNSISDIKALTTHPTLFFRYSVLATHSIKYNLFFITTMLFFFLILIIFKLISCISYSQCFILKWFCFLILFVCQRAGIYLNASVWFLSLRMGLWQNHM